VYVLVTISEVDVVERDDGEGKQDAREDQCGNGDGDHSWQRSAVVELHGREERTWTQTMRKKILADGHSNMKKEDKRT